MFASGSHLDLTPQLPSIARRAPELLADRGRLELNPASFIIIEAKEAAQDSWSVRGKKGEVDMNLISQKAANGQSDSDMKVFDMIAAGIEAGGGKTFPDFRSYPVPKGSGWVLEDSHRNYRTFTREVVR
jgi:hypothetical protein